MSLSFMYVYGCIPLGIVLKLYTWIDSLQVEWSGGTDTMDEALGKIHLREAASVKRERAMAYAFSHQVSQHNLLILL